MRNMLQSEWWEVCECDHTPASPNTCAYWHIISHEYEELQLCLNEYGCFALLFFTISRLNIHFSPVAAVECQSLLAHGRLKCGLVEVLKNALAERFSLSQAHKLGYSLATAGYIIYSPSFCDKPLLFFFLRAYMTPFSTKNRKLFMCFGGLKMHTFENGFQSARY